MMMLLWRALAAWRILALVYWHPSHYVGCTEQQQDVQLLPSQDISLEEEPEDKTQHHKVDETLVSHVQSLSIYDPQTAGGQVEERLATQALVEEEEQNVEALEMEQPVSEMEPEPERGVPEPESEPGPQLPHTYVTQDQESTSDPDATPPLPDPVAAAVPEGPPSTFPSQDLTLNSVSEDVIPDVSTSELSDGDQTTADCEAEETNPFDNASPPVVLENTSNAHSAGTKTHTDPSLSPQAGQGTPSLGQVVNASHMLTEEGLSPHVAVETDPSVPPEDIPTFDEWKRKVMEVEKEKTQAAHTTTNGSPYPVKKVPKNFNNYASVECGAKILGANPEAKSTSAILMENMDLYMLNPCSNKIWFVIELCEPIQLKQLDIANFELFSSTPRDFLVSISDRYPTNKWLKLGTFHARDERTVQSFPLDEHLYAKYIKMFTKYLKVELVSHFGSEHFCPLSLIRVFGTSMVEEYEEIADPSERPDDQDDDFDYPPGYVPGEDKSSKNLIGSAKDAILNIVINIADALGGGPETGGNISSQGLNITETSYQLDPTITITAITTLPSMSDTEEVEIPTDPDVPAAESPSPETPSPEPPVPDIPATEAPQLELPLEEDKVVTPLQEDEEEEEEDESISSTITLLEEEDDEAEEEREKEEQRRRQQESLEYCSVFPVSSSFSSPSTRSCSASLQEYLQWQCSALLSKQREHRALEREPAIPPRTHTPSWQLPVYPSACPTPQQPHTETHQVQEREHTPGQGERETNTSEPPDPPQDQGKVEGEWRSERPLLEPSQTSILPRPNSATESPAATATVELPQLSTKDLPEELRPESSQEVQPEREQIGPTATISIPAPVTDEPNDSATADQVWVPPAEEKPNTDVQIPEPEVSIQTMDITDLATVFPSSEQQSAPPAEPEAGDTTHEVSPPAPPTTEPEHSGGPTATITETRMEDLVEDIMFSSSNSNGQLLPHPSSLVPPPSSPNSEFYAELNVAEQGNGNQVYGSGQKESVFMRLNNRIKALEMNMSLSGRYLEQLSQRYRKQMEEMQRAFNKTIIKLQNTSRIAEEQDQRQTESIQLLQGQLENITQLVLNLSVRVSQLQGEVSDRQSYLMLCLVLCLFLGLLLCANHCRISAMPPTIEPEPAIPKSYSYCCPEREFTACEDMGLKRAASYPLLHSESYQFPTTEGPESLHTDERQRLSPANRRKRRSKVKHSDKVETLKPSHTAPELANGAVVCNGAPRSTNPAPPTRGLLHPVFRDSPSEGSSEGSSHSDDPSFCGITTACTRLCDGLPPPRTRAEKRALRRRRSKPACMVADVPHAPRRDNNVQDLLTKNKDTFGMSAPLSGPV